MRSAASGKIQTAVDDDARPKGRRRKRPDGEQVVADCEAVIEIAAVLFNVAGREMRHPGRTSAAVCRVRQIAMYVTHVVLGHSMREVGDGFGRDRTTVLHACHQIEDLRDDAEFDLVVNRFERVVRAAFRNTRSSSD